MLKKLVVVITAVLTLAGSASRAEAGGRRHSYHGGYYHPRSVCGYGYGYRPNRPVYGYVYGYQPYYGYRRHRARAAPLRKLAAEIGL
jgi:hypothetical protein